jgi:hypothetical protein
MGKKRLRVEALLAAAASPVPPPAADLVPDATLAADLVQAPGKNYNRCGFGLVDWRDGWLDFELADGRRAAPLVAQLRRAAARSHQRGRIAMVILDNLGIHTPKGSRLLRALLAELGEQLVLVYTPHLRPRRQPHRVVVAGLAPHGHPHPPASAP